MSYNWHAFFRLESVIMFHYHWTVRIRQAEESLFIVINEH